MYKSVYQCNVINEQKEKNFQEALAYVPYVFDDIRSFKSAMDRNDYNTAVAEAEQIGEKSLKAIAKKNGKLSSTMQHKKGHDLSYLATECGSEIVASKDELKFLTDGYFKARYPDGKKKYTKEEAEYGGKTACNLADKMIEELDISNSDICKELGEVDDVKNIGDLSIWNRIMNK